MRILHLSTTKRLMLAIGGPEPIQMRVGWLQPYLVTLTLARAPRQVVVVDVQTPQQLSPWMVVWTPVFSQAPSLLPLVPPSSQPAWQRVAVGAAVALAVALAAPAAAPSPTRHS